MGSIRLYFILVTFSATVCLIEGKLRTMRDCGLKGIVDGVDPLTGKSTDGGKPTDSGHYPWLVSLQLNVDGWIHQCSGVIINRRWVVTAAHCFANSSETSDYSIVAGEYKFPSSKFRAKGKRYEVRKIIIHENYDRQNISNDIALVRTAKGLRVDSGLGIANGICLPPKDEEPTGTAVVAGSENIRRGKSTDVLHKVEVPLISREKCAELSPKNTVSESNICAGATGKDSCQNYNGGPLMQQNSEGRFVLVGIISSSVGCPSENPGIYTRVSGYIDWMDANMSVRRKKGKKTV